MASLQAVLDNAIRESRPRLRGELVGRAVELFTFKQLATLQDAPGVERPADRPTDWAGAAAAARERGMKRLAARLSDGV